MNKNIIILAVIALILIGGGTYIFVDYMEQQSIAEEKARQEKMIIERAKAEEAAIMSRTKCTSNDNYFVVTLDRNGGVGQDIVVKEKKGSEPSCTYSVVAGDYEIKNSDPEYFKAVEAKALVTDVGTGPSGRSLRLYDLTDKSLITEKKYFGELSIKDGTLIYSGEAKSKADKKNCTDFAKITADGFTPVLTVEKTVDLKTFLVKEGKTTKCVASQ